MRIAPVELLPRLTLPRLALLAIWCSAAGCNITPSAPREGILDPAFAAGPASDALFTPELRGVPFYSDLTPETDGAEGGDFDVDVSPDGGRIVFASTRHTTEPKIFLKDTQSGALYQKSSGPGSDLQPKFSPDGEWIAFATNREGNFDLVIIPTHRTEAFWQLASSAADEIHPTWSPDAKRIAYSARDRATNEWVIWLVDIDGQRRSQLGPGLYPEWSPDGKHLAFQRASLRGQGWYGIWVVEVGGGAPREIATDAEMGFIQPAWSPNSKQLVFSAVRSTQDTVHEPPRAEDLWLVDLDTQQRLRLTSDSFEDYAPAWGLDGRIYFTSTRSACPRVWSLLPSAFARPGAAAPEAPALTHREGNQP